MEIQRMKPFKILSTVLLILLSPVASAVNAETQSEQIVGSGKGLTLPELNTLIAQNPEVSRNNNILAVIRPDDGKVVDVAVLPKLDITPEPPPADPHPMCLPSSQVVDVAM